MKPPDNQARRTRQNDDFYHLYTTPFYFKKTYLATTGVIENNKSTAYPALRTPEMHAIINLTVALLETSVAPLIDPVGQPTVSTGDVRTLAEQRQGSQERKKQHGRNSIAGK